MQHRAPRARRTVLSVAVPVGLVTSLALTWGATHAAFSATTDNPGNSWQAGSVVLSQSQSGSALFTSEGGGPDGLLKPGSSGKRCIRLDYKGSLEADIRMYIEPDRTQPPDTDAKELDGYLLMSIERGEDVTPGTPEAAVKANCEGFRSTTTATFLDSATHTDAPTEETTRTLGHLRTEHRDYDSGIVVHARATSEKSMTLRITYVLRGDSDNGAQNKQSEATFTWEARNTPPEAQDTP